MHFIISLLFVASAHHVVSGDYGRGTPLPREVEQCQRVYRGYGPDRYQNEMVYVPRLNEWFCEAS